MNWLTKIAYTPEEEEELKKWVKGTCYKDAGMLAILNDMDLVHGIVTSPGVFQKTPDGRYIPKPYGHAWCEKDGMVYDSTIGIGVAEDHKTANPSTAWPIEKYYKNLNAKITARYEHNDIASRAFKQNTWGPWENKK